MSREKMWDRNLLVPAVEKFCSENYREYSISQLMSKGGNRHRIEVTADGMEFFLDFHFKANGSTSIDISSGHHMDIKKKIKDMLIQDPAYLMTSAKE